MRRTGLLVLLAGVAAVLVACRERATETGPSPDAPFLALAPSASESPASPSEEGRNDTSIYALSMTLTDQDGVKTGLDAFRGKPVFIGMFYGTCPSACPLLVSTIKRTLSELDASTAAEVRVLLVSFDPERDTPEALHAIVVQRGLDARWKLASAPEDQVRDLAAVLGIQYRRLPDGNFSHTSSIVLLDRAGAVATRLDDTSLPVDALVARTRAIAARP
jgi:protein SCO1/2